MSKEKLHGLVAAAHTPFHPDGALNLAIVEAQAAHLIRNRVSIVFIGGTTGEWSSLTVDERRDLSKRWIEVARGTELKVIVHVGSNCVADSRNLAKQAEELGACAISALAPSYFKPGGVPLLVQTMGEIAAAAPATPFYYYEIPSLTGLNLSPSTFLEQAAEQIPTLRGIKFTSNNLVEYQLSVAARDGQFDIPFGFDEILLAGLSLGATGAVGSTYNFAAPIYHRLIAAFRAGDLETARREQSRSVRMIAALASRNFMASAKAVMTMLGVDVGPARLPNAQLSREQQGALRNELGQLGFFDWLK